MARSIDPGEHQRALNGDAMSAVRKALAFFPLMLYFWGYWPLKEHARRAIRISAISFLSLSFLFLVVEVVCELAGSSRLAHDLLESENAIVDVGIKITFLLAVLFLFIDHWKEVKQTRSRAAVDQETKPVAANRPIGPGVA